jgi:hypothetical protein
MPVVPVLAAIGGGSAAAGALSAGTAALGAYSTIKGISDAKKAQAQAQQSAQNAGVNISEVSRMAEDQAMRNIQRSREVEQQYAPENAQFRTASMHNLLSELGRGAVSPETMEFINQQMGRTTGVGPIGVTGMNAAQFGVSDTAAPSRFDAVTMSPEQYAASTTATREANSALLGNAIARAQQELDMGGALPQDVRNLIARTAAARSGVNTGNLGLGRDMTARDLGLTSLQLRQQRLDNASRLGQAQLGADQFNVGTGLQAGLANMAALNAAAQGNAAMRQSASQFNAGSQNNILQFLAQLQQQTALANTQGRNQAAAQNAQLQQQAALANADASNVAARQGAQMAQQANQFDVGQGMSLAQLLAQLGQNNFGNALNAAQFGQTIQSPVVGLDPSAIANLAVGNSNVQSGAAQNAAAITANRAQGASQLGGQLLGLGASMYGNRPQQQQQTPTLPSYTVPTGLNLGSNLPSVPGFSPSK